MEKIVGIKYCGGCNPLHDRKRYVQNLIKMHPEWKFHDADEKKNFDILYVVCGCERRCAQYADYKAEEYRIVTNMGEY